MAVRIREFQFYAADPLGGNREKGELMIGAFLFMIASFTFEAPAFPPMPDSTLAKCLDIFPIRGGWCDDFQTSFGLKVKNVCSDKIEVMIALQKGDGSSDITILTLGSGEISTRAYVCRGTGRYKYWVRLYRSKEPFPTSKSIVFD